MYLAPACDACPDAIVAATYAWVKYCRPWITPSTTANRITGLTDGSVTQRMRCNGPAPSSCADSYRCCGTSSTAARKITIVLPTPQRASSTSDGFDQCGDWNQSGPWIPRCPRTVFTGPVAGLRM